MKTQTLPFAAALAMVASLLAACGGGAAPAGPGELSLTGTDEFKFDPPTLTVPAGQTVNLTFKNAGSVEHSFAIFAAGEELDHILEEMSMMTGEDEMHDELLFEMHELAGGASNTESFTAPAEAGEYVFICTVPGHAQAGMAGTLTVTP